MNLNKSIIGPISLFIGLLIYYLLAILAIFNCSEGFDIYNDLWNHLRWFEYNLDDAMFFRIGNVIYALVLASFFLSFNERIAAETERKFPTYLIKAIGIYIATSMIIGEIMADQATIFAIASGTSLLLTIAILIRISLSLHSHPEFWKGSILLFIISIALSSYLLLYGNH